MGHRAREHSRQTHKERCTGRIHDPRQLSQHQKRHAARDEQQGAGWPQSPGPIIVEYMRHTQTQDYCHRCPKRHNVSRSAFRSPQMMHKFGKSKGQRTCQDECGICQIGQPKRAAIHTRHWLISGHTVGHHVPVSDRKAAEFHPNTAESLFQRTRSTTACQPP